MSQTKRLTIESAENLLGKYFPVLDHGFISLVDYMGSDESVVQAARSSYGPGTKTVNNDKGLTRYLMRHWHTTPSEMVELKFHIKLPIFVARQWIRHRTASVNEYSGRYSLMPMQFYTPEKENFCLQAKDNKQGRSNIATEGLYEQSIEKLKESRETTIGNYEWLLEADVAKEIARIDLPSSMYTEWYWKIDLHNLMNFLRLRCDGHAQFEIREYANLLAGMFSEIAPVSYDAWVDYRFCSKNFSHMELDLLSKIVDKKLVEELTSKSSLTKREKSEFIDKLCNPSPRPNFELDFNSVKTSEYFYEKLLESMPKVKK